MEIRQYMAKLGKKGGKIAAFRMTKAGRAARARKGGQAGETRKPSQRSSSLGETGERRHNGPSG
ncbi:MAG TPA: hypothetical protein VLE22_05805 [Bryobacteraceae bacterium]|nr:hypothetical protein [Bryobacteraceae bacterium]